DNGVHEAALVRSRRRSVLGEDLVIKSGEAVVEQREQDQRQPGHAEQGSCEAKPSNHDVTAAPARIDPVHGVNSPPSFPGAAASSAPPPARRTSTRTATARAGSGRTGAGRRFR